MKIYSKKKFLKLPSGTFFAKGIKWSIDGFCVKGESLGETDFFYTNLVLIDAFNSEELCDRQYEMLEKGTSYPINESEYRDGTFCDEDIFLVFEKNDLEKIISLMNNTIDIP